MCTNKLLQKIGNGYEVSRNPSKYGHYTTFSHPVNRASIDVAEWLKPLDASWRHFEKVPIRGRPNYYRFRCSPRVRQITPQQFEQIATQTISNWQNEK